MRTSGIRPSSIKYVAVAAVAAFALAACSSSDKTASPSTNPVTTTTAAAPTTTSATPSTPAAGGPVTVKVATTSLGEILVDGKGMTLYVDEKDKPGAPNCTGSCLTAWPPVPAPDTFTGGPGVDGKKFSAVTAADGTQQLAVDGAPLYLWVNDHKPGDVTGQDVNGFYVVGKDYKKIEDDDS